MPRIKLRSSEESKVALMMSENAFLCSASRKAARIGTFLSSSWRHTSPPCNLLRGANSFTRVNRWSLCAAAAFDISTRASVRFLVACHISDAVVKAECKPASKLE
jgi:hypothetical protein